MSGGRRHPVGTTCARRRGDDPEGTRIGESAAEPICGQVATSSTGLAIRVGESPAPTTSQLRTSHHSVPARSHFG
jgi:hypothetical protein